jgi:hypothetical protein
MFLPAVVLLFFRAPDVHRISDGVYFRTEVPTTLGVVVNSTCDNDLFAAGVIGIFGNLYLGLDIASALKTKRLVPNLGDSRTGAQTYWYGAFAGYTPGQLEFRFDRLWSASGFMAVGAGIETEVPLYTNTLTSADASVEPVSYEYQASAYVKQRGRYVVQVGGLVSRGGLGCVLAYSTLRTFNIGLAFDIGKF